MILPTLLLALALAQDEHSAPSFTRHAVQAAPVPPGPPQLRRVDPGADLQAVVWSLPAGSTLTLTPGAYRGPLVIDRALRLEGEGARLEGGGAGTVLVVAADDVQVRGLTVTGSGSSATNGDAGVHARGARIVFEDMRVEQALTGFDLAQVNDGAVLGCTVLGMERLPMGQRGDGVRLWESNRNRVEGNRLHGVRDLVVWYSYDNTFRGNVVTGSRYGVHFMHADRNRVEGNEFTQDIVGIFVMYSDAIVVKDNLIAAGRGAAGTGIGLKESSDLLIQGNRIVGSTTGMLVDTTPHRIGESLQVEGNTLAFNIRGVRFHGPKAGARFVDNRFHENTTQVAVDGKGDSSMVEFLGNVWSDYAGYDLDGDGLGDVPWEARAVSDSLRDRHPELAFFQGTPAAWLLDLLGSVLPLFAPPVIARDPRPRLEAR